MPTTKSAIKAARQNLKRRKFNLLTQNKVKAAVKQFKKLTTAGKLEEARKALENVFSAYDKAAKKGIIKKNNANRHKSRLSKLIASNKKAA
ncbi:MAG: 30S ribosomal protein S20 [Candidatus Doudnabacteria bacterium]|nr:30S ribosomal protein S20 [Candidatus Doudnabacteria bacterium]